MTNITIRRNMVMLTFVIFVRYIFSVGVHLKVCTRFTSLVWNELACAWCIWDKILGRVANSVVIVFEAQQQNAYFTKVLKHQLTVCHLQTVFIPQHVRVACTQPDTRQVVIILTYIVSVSWTISYRWFSARLIHNKHRLTPFESNATLHTSTNY